MASITNVRVESNLGFRLAAQLNTTATSIVGDFFDTVTGLARDPNATNRTNMLIVLDKGDENNANQQWECVLATSMTGGTPVGRWTLTIVRNLTLTGNDTASGTTGKAHQANSVGYCVDVAQLYNSQSDVFSGTKGTGGNSFRTGDETAADVKRYFQNDQSDKPYDYYDESAQRPRIHMGDDGPSAGLEIEFAILRGTTVQLAALPELPAGGMIAYDTTLGEIVFREGGAWVQKTGGGSVPDATTTTAGKVEAGTTTDNTNSSATGESGAKTMVSTDTVKATPTGQGQVPCSNSSSKLNDAWVSESSVMQHLKKQFTTGENIAVADAVRTKEDGMIYKAEKFRKVSAWFEANNGEDPSTTYKCACSIDTNKVVYIFDAAANTKAFVVTWDGDNPTFGAVANITATNPGWSTGGYKDVCKVDTDKFAVVMWADTAAGVDDGEICVCTVSGTTITVGTSVAFEGGTQIATSLNRLCSPATDVVAVVWENADTGSDCYARVATISTRTPTFGAEVEIDGTNTSGSVSDVCEIGTNKFVVVHLGADSDLYAEACTLSGNTITEGADTELVDSITVASAIRASKVATDKFVATYNDGTNFKMICCTVSGTTITPGTPITVPSNSRAISAAYSQIVYLSDNRCAFAYVDTTGVTNPNYHTKMFVVSFSGTVPTLNQIGDSSFISNPDTWGVTMDMKDLVNINGDQFQVYSNDSIGNDNYVLNFSDNNFIGFADETIASGNPCYVNLWKDDNQVGLSTGATYFLGANGVLARTGDVEAGTAISSTEIIKK